MSRVIRKSGRFKTNIFVIRNLEMKKLLEECIDEY
jgi:hypothetical protein